MKGYERALYRRGSAYSASLGYTELREQSYTGLCMADERALQNRLGRARGKNVGERSLEYTHQKSHVEIHTQTFGHHRGCHVKQRIVCNKTIAHFQGSVRLDSNRASEPNH